jgi:hypothetical protein
MQTKARRLSQRANGNHVAGTYDGTKLQLYIDGSPWGYPALLSGSISSMSVKQLHLDWFIGGRTVCGDCPGTRLFQGDALMKSDMFQPCSFLCRDSGYL